MNPTAEHPLTTLLDDIVAAAKGPCPVDEYMNIVRPDNMIALVSALRVAREALDFYAKGRAKSHRDICHYTLDGGAGARNALTHIDELFIGENVQLSSETKMLDMRETKMNPTQRRGVSKDE